MDPRCCAIDPSHDWSWKSLGEILVFSSNKCCAAKWMLQHAGVCTSLVIRKCCQLATCSKFQTWEQHDTTKTNRSILATKASHWLRIGSALASWFYMCSHHSKDTEAALADARLAVAKASICSGPAMLAKVCDSSGFGCADVSWPMPRIFWCVEAAIWCTHRIEQKPWKPGPWLRLV